MAKDGNMQKNILKLTEGVLETAVDLTLFCALIGLDIFTLVDKRRVYHPRIEDSDWVFNLFEKIRYKSLKNALYNARKKGFIKKAGTVGKTKPKITAAGRKRLEKRLSIYRYDRTWDGILHLVTYDVPEQRKNEREILRRQLKKIGCGMLQKSVWITPYNPRNILKQFIAEKKLKGAIIISSVGSDGSVGEESVTDLIYKVYKLSKLNKQYKQFVETYAKLKRPFPEAIFAYQSILENDPQLPYELLPKNWAGNKANKIYRRQFKLLESQGKD